MTRFVQILGLWFIAFVCGWALNLVAGGGRNGASFENLVFGIVHAMITVPFTVRVVGDGPRTLAPVAAGTAVALFATILTNDILVFVHREATMKDVVISACCLLGAPALAAPVAIELSRRRLRVLIACDLTRCGQCEYPRNGLPPGTPCPECGAEPGN